MAHDHSLSTEDVLEDVADADDLSLVNTSVIRLGCALLGLSLPGVAACYFYVRIGISGRLTSVCGNKEVRLNESCLDGFNVISNNLKAFSHLVLACFKAAPRQYATSSLTRRSIPASWFVVMQCGPLLKTLQECSARQETANLQTPRAKHTCTDFEVEILYL